MLLALGLAAPVVAQQNAITLTAKPTTVVYGKATTLSGQVTGAGNAGATVELEELAAPFSGGYKTVATAVTDAAGNFSFSRTPPVNTRYRTTVKIKGKQTSPLVTVLVAPKVTLRVSDSTPRKGQRVRFRGIVTPGHDSKTVALQRRSAGTWKTIKTTTLVSHTPLNNSTRSKYSLRAKVRRTGTYRVYLSSNDADHSDGISRTRKLTVG